MQNVIPRFRSRPDRLTLILFASVALLLAGCGLNAQAPAAAAPATSVSVQLSWIHTIEWAGFYVADDQGYYADEGLAVNLIAGGEDAQGNYINAIETVLDGRADFGVASGGNLLQARANNAPLVAIASIYQRHPLGFTSLAEKQIAGPRDLIGKTVQLSPDSNLLFQAMLNAQGIDPALIKIEERTDFTIAPLIDGKADVIDTFVTNEIVTYRLKGYAVNNILPVEYGVEEYPNVIFTTEKMIAERPDLVERFLRATIQGMQSAIANPQQPGALALRHDASLDPTKETEAMYQSLPLLNPAGSRPGMMNGSTWETTQRILHEQGILKQPLDVKAAYTTAFLEKIYTN